MDIDSRWILTYFSFGSIQLGRGNSERKDGERTRRGLDIDLEDHKVQRIPADEFAPKKLTLQLDLEKPSLGDEKSPSERRQPQPPQLQQQKPSKSEVKHEKSGKYLLLYFCIWFLVLERRLIPFLDLDFLLCCSYACCYTTYANTCWRLAGEFPTVRVSFFSRWMHNVHRGLPSGLVSEACCVVSWQLHWSSPRTISSWSSSHGRQARVF